MAGNQTLKRLMWAGVWWPTMNAEAYAFAKNCDKCRHKPPRPSATLFQIIVAPKWSDYLVDYIVVANTQRMQIGPERRLFK